MAASRAPFSASRAAAIRADAPSVSSRPSEKIRSEAMRFCPVRAYSRARRSTCENVSKRPFAVSSSVTAWGDMAVLLSASSAATMEVTPRETLLVQNSPPWPLATYACCAMRTSNTDRDRACDLVSKSRRATASASTRDSPFQKRYAVTPNATMNRISNVRRAARLFIQAPPTSAISQLL